MLIVKLLNVQLQDIQTVVLAPEKTTQQACLMGRAANCELGLDSVEVSRVHSKIQLQNNQYYYSDLDSANGSYINNKKLLAHHDCLLRVGDSISIGDFLLLIEAIEPASEEAKSGDGNAKPVALLGNRLSENSRNQNHLGNRIWDSKELAVRCVRITDETADVKTFTFVAEPAISFDYKPGQFVNLELDINGETVLRSYSISSSPTRPYTIEITVKRVPALSGVPQAPPGLVSNWLHGHLKVGSQVKLGGILGKFTCLPKPAAKLLMISAGSGITPMMSMSRWVADTARAIDIVFFHCARTPGDIIFRQELELMAARLPNFHLAIAVTQPQPGQPWLSYTGRLSESMLHLIAPDFCDRTVYVCGPEGFMQSVKTLLEHLNFPMQNYFEENFGGSKKAKKAEPKAPHSPLSPSPNSATAVPSEFRAAPIAAPASTHSIVRFAQSGTEVTADGTESILELAEQANIKIRSNCQQGVCGACKKRKLEGLVRYESDPDGLDADEQANGFILTCVALPVDRVVVEA